MNPEIYTLMAAIEDQHWWFRARRALVANQLGRLGLSPDSSILDAGCGTGGNLAMLCRHGHVEAMEMDAQARTIAAGKALARVREGILPDALPFPESHFDLITLLDVLEHVDEDEAALDALGRRLKPGGYLVITVPAFAFLWSRHDEAHHHKRRYRIRDLKQKAIAAGMEITYASYFNTLLFPLIAAVRLVDRLRPSGWQQGDLAMPPLWLNNLLYVVFSSERWLLGRMSFPFGVSALLVARKPS